MSDSWVDLSEDILIENLNILIKQEEDEDRKKQNKFNKYIDELASKLDFSFEPDESYRDNVKYMILGLVFCQILKQKTITLYKRGKEDREYLGSYLMMKIQVYIREHFSQDKWNEVIKKAFEYYEGKIKINDTTKNLINNPISNKILQNDILVTTVLNNKKLYYQIKNKYPIEYI